MKEKVLEYFAALGESTPEEEQLVSEVFSRAEFGAKQKMLFQGDICQSIYFITSGLTRYAFIDDQGNDVTLSFRKENEWITDYESFLKQTPTHFFIECLEPTQCLKVSYHGLQRIYNETAVGNLIGRKIAEELYLESQERLNAFYNKTAEERFLDFMKHNGSLVNRVPQNHLASFIGIKPQSLSRIKRRQSS